MTSRLPTLHQAVDAVLAARDDAEHLIARDILARVRAKETRVRRKNATNGGGGRPTIAIDAERLRVLFVVDRWSVPAIAKLLGASESTIRTRINHAGLRDERERMDRQAK